MATETLLPPDAPLPAAAPATADPRPARPEPGLTVLLGAEAAAAPVRHGGALVLVEAAPDAVADDVHPEGFVLPLLELQDLEVRHRRAMASAADAAQAAGFEPAAAEVVARHELVHRLAILADPEVSCLAAVTPSARLARRYARALRAPVLAVPPDAPPSVGPAVLPAAHAGRLVPAALALATERVVLAGRSPADFEPAAAVAEEHGLEVLEAVELDEAVGAAVAHGGVLVAHDPGGWRAPALLRSGLRARRPVLLVPSRLGARRAD